jgi:hypothetical protein
VSTNVTKTKTEMGRVHYLTTWLTFPHDKDEWVKQEPIAGASTRAVFRFINGLKVPDLAKADLCRKLETSWKDNNGVWVRLKIETTKRNKKWGNRLELGKLSGQF